MVKTTAPQFSIDASGKLADVAAYSSWKGRSYLKTIPKPADPKTPQQIAMRAFLTWLSREWKKLTTVQRLTWHGLADDRRLPPYYHYIEINCERWRNNLAPGKSYPITNTGVPPSIGVICATGLPQALKFTWPCTHPKDSWAFPIYRGPANIYQPQWHELLHVEPDPWWQTYTYIWRHLPPGLTFIGVHGFTGDGVWRPYCKRTWGTVLP